MEDDFKEKLNDLAYRLETEGSEEVYDCLKELIYLLLEVADGEDGS